MKFNNKNVLVTGGAGFIGSHLTDRLVKEEANVTVLDNLSYGHEENVPQEANFINGDVRDFQSLCDIVADQQLIFHLAACATTKESSMGWADPIYDYEVNTLGSLNVLRAIVETNSKAQVIYTSSAAVYGNIQYTPIDESHPTDPVSPYGVSKLTGEKYCLAYYREHGVPVSILRIFNTYGPRQPRYVMHDLIMKLLEDTSMLPILGDGLQTRDFCYVDDTVNAFIMACDYPGEVFNVASGIPTTIKEVAEAIKSEIAPEAKIISQGDTWRGDIRTLLGDVTRLREKGFSITVDVKSGIKRLIASYDEIKSVPI